MKRTKKRPIPMRRSGMTVAAQLRAGGPTGSTKGKKAYTRHPKHKGAESWQRTH